MQNTRASHYHDRFQSPAFFVLSSGIIGILSRLIIHPPGMTAFTSFCILTGVVSRTRFSTAIFILALGLLSDHLLTYCFGLPLWGGWMLFTYSGYFLLYFLGYYFPFSHRFVSSLILFSLGSLLFWVWTNLGAWLMSGFYFHTLQGFLQCYVAALPFLHNGLMGDLLWGLLMVYSQQIFQFLYSNSHTVTLKI